MAGICPTCERAMSYPRSAKKKKKMQEKVSQVMEEYSEGTLHSGSKKGPRVKKKKQAIAIALSEGRKAVKKKTRRKKKK